MLFKQAKAPTRYEETDYYNAHARLPPNQQLPSGELLSAIHAYVSKLYSRNAESDRRPVWKCMDETALIALGILMEETAREVLGETGDFAFVEAADDEEEKLLDPQKENASADVNVVLSWHRNIHKALWYASKATSERMPIMPKISKFDEYVADIQIQSSSSRSIVTSKTSITSTTANMPRTRDGYDFCMAAMDESHNYPRVSIRTKRKISWARCLNCVDQCGSFNGMEK